MTFLIIAWRNILRNYRRSTITILAIAVGFAGLIFAQGFFGGEKSQMLRNSITIFAGHIQLHKKGFLDDPSITKRIDISSVEQTLRANSNIKSYSPRVEGGGLLATENKSMGGFVLGIDPERELSTSTISKSIISGRYLSENDTNKAMIGAKLAQKLQLYVGGQVVVLTQAVDGAIAAQKYEIVGIYDTKVENLDGFSVMITLSDAQDLYSLGSNVTGITLKVKNPDILDKTIAELKPLETMGMDIDKWDKLLPEIATEMLMNKMTFRFMLLVTLIIMAIGIVNTISISMLEREREFGMMMALGTRNAQIFAISLYESILLGLLGSTLGSVAGFAINSYYKFKGVDLSAYSDVIKMLPGLSPIIYTTLEPSFFITTSMWVIAITVLASISPALRVSRLEPVEAIRGLHKQKNGNTKTLPDILPIKDIFFLIAWRNIIRNRNRSLITILAIGAGLAGVIFFYSVLNGFANQMITNMTRYMIGDMQVSNSNYENDKSPQNTVLNLGKIKETLNQNKDVKIYAERVEQEVIVSSADSSQNGLMLGIEAEKEKQFSRFNEVVKDGKYLSPGDKNGILLGDKLAQKLHVGVGDKVVLTGQDSVGSVSSESFRVVGILDTGADSFDGVLAVTNIDTAKSMLAMDGVSVVMMNLSDRNALEKVKTELSVKLSGSGNSIRSWKDISPMLEQFVFLARDSLNIMASVIFGVTLFSVINTILISIIERTKEFGLMSAMGTSRQRVVWIVFLESLILSAFGVIAGNIMGAIITIFLTIFGFDLRVLAPGVNMDFIQGIGLVIYPVYSVGTVLYPSVVIFVLSLLTCLYPAWRAASLDPVRALRHV